MLTLALLAVSVAAGIWWVGYISYDPLAIYRPIPASAMLVGRHLQLPARWNDLLANPLALALMRTAGVDVEAAAELVADGESRKWFEKLAGREGTLAYLPGRFGMAPAWMAVSYLGGESQKLRWQLSVFRLPGFKRMKPFSGRSVWRVDSPDLEPGQTLAIAFGEGVIMACLSENPLAIAEVLAAYDGRGQRLMDAERSFSRLVKNDDRLVPDRFWIRDESEYASVESPGVVVEVPALRGDAISLSAATEGVVRIPEDRAPLSEMGPLARRLGNAPCAAAMVARKALLQLLTQPDLQPDARHALRMILDVATEDRVAVVAMDGELGGRLAWGAMGTLGLSGLRVPTLLLATPVPDAAAGEAAIQRVLDTSNARYKAAFVLQPVSAPPATIHVLASAGGDEWVDELPQSDRPAYVLLDGWLLASSNLGALQKLAQGAALAEDAPGMPAWAAHVAGPPAVSLWLDLVRSGKVARDAIATWSMAQMFLNSGNSKEIREQLNEIKAWIDAFAPLGEGRASLGRRNGTTVLSMDLGLSGAGVPE
ncbi:MAG TPA: hypothetical protein DCM68_06015 [Verrucomicrobia bacterium]|nr:hypothetical protein [Verrucomicrobiota bacterium]